MPTDLTLPIVPPFRKRQLPEQIALFGTEPRGSAPVWRHATATLRQIDNAGRRILHANDDGDEWQRATLRRIPSCGVRSPRWQPTGTTGTTVEGTSAGPDSDDDETPQ